MGRRLHAVPLPPGTNPDAVFAFLERGLVDRRAGTASPTDATEQLVLALQAATPDLERIDHADGDVELRRRDAGGPVRVLLRGDHATIVLPRRALEGAPLRRRLAREALDHLDVIVSATGWWAFDPLRERFHADAFPDPGRSHDGAVAGRARRVSGLRRRLRPRRPTTDPPAHDRRSPSSGRGSDD